MSSHTRSVMAALLITGIVLAGCGDGGGGGGTPDTTAPTVDSFTIDDTSPTSSATVNITVTASDTGGSGLSKYLIVEDSAAAPVAADFDTSGTTAVPTTYTLTGGDGAHTLYAWVIDGAGNIAATSLDATITLDATAPAIVSITRAGTSPTNTSTVVFTVTVSEDVTGLITSHFTETFTGTLSGGITNIAGGPDVYTVTIATLAGEGTVRLDLLPDDDSVTDDAGNPLGGAGAQGFTSGEVFDVDRVAPTVTSIVRVDTTPSGAATLNFTVTFHEDVTGVDATDFTTTITGDVVAGTPVVTGGPDVYNVAVDVTSGEGTLRLDVVDDDTIADAFHSLGGTGASNGDFDTGEAYDIDATPPEVVSIVRADPDPTNAPSVDFTVTFSEAVTGVDATDFALTATGTAAGTIGTPTTTGNIVWTVPVSGLTGLGTLQLDLSDDDTIVDTLHVTVANPLGGTGTQDYTAGEAYTVDRDSPTVVSIVRADANPTSAASVDFTVTFSEALDPATVDATDFTLTTGAVAATVGVPTTADDIAWTVPVTIASGDGSLRLDVDAANDITDSVGTPLGTGYTGGEAYTVDNTLPTVDSFAANPTVGKLPSVDLTLTASDTNGVAKYLVKEDNPTPPDLADFDTAPTSAPATWTFTGGDGMYDLQAWVLDNAGNISAGSAVVTVTIDSGPPTVGGFSVSPNGTINTAMVTADISANDTGTGIAAYLVVEDDSTQPFAGDFAAGSTTTPFSYDIVGGDGARTLYAWAMDDAGNVSTDVVSVIVTLDTEAPEVESIVRADSNPTSGASVNYTVTFTEAVSGVAVGDFLLTTTGTVTGTVGAPSGGATVYNVQITGLNGEGTLRLDLIDDDSIVDGATNVLGGAGAQDYASAEVYDVDRDAPTLSSSTPADTATGVPTNTLIVMYFDEPMNETSVTTPGNITVDDGAAVAGTVTYSAAGHVATFTPAAALANDTLHTVTISTSVTDAIGNAIVLTTFSFTTAAGTDDLDPTIDSFSIVEPTTEGPVTISMTESDTGGSGVIRWLIKQDDPGTPSVADMLAGDTARPTSFAVADDTAGTITLYAWVMDGANNISASANDIVELTLPTVTNNQPQNGESDLGPTREIEVEFDRAMDTSSVEAATTLDSVADATTYTSADLVFVWDGDTRVSIYLDADASGALSNPDILPDEDTLTLTIDAATALGAYGSNLDETLVVQFSTRDITSASLLSILTEGPVDLLLAAAPEDEVTAGDTLTFNFDENMDPASTPEIELDGDDLELEVRIRGYYIYQANADPGAGTVTYHTYDSLDVSVTDVVDIHGMRDPDFDQTSATIIDVPDGNSFTISKTISYVTIVSATASGGAVTYVTATDHNLYPGDMVDIVGCSDGNFDQTDAYVDMVSSNTEFIVFAGIGDSSSTGGTVSRSHSSDGTVITGSEGDGTLAWTGARELTWTLADDVAPGEYRLNLWNVQDANRMNFWMDDDLTVQISAASQDGTAPSLVATFPADGATDVPATSPIVLRFSESVDQGTLSTVTITDGGGLTAADFDLETDSDDMITQVVFVPRNAMTGTATVTVPASVLDLSGMALDPAPVVVSFTIEAGGDATKPTVVETSPEDGATAVCPYPRVRARFSEQIDTTVDPSNVSVENVTDSRLSRGWTYDFEGDRTIQLDNPDDGIYPSEISQSLVDATGVGNQATYTTNGAHTLQAGDYVWVRWMDNGAFNFDGEMRPIDSVTSNTFTITLEWGVDSQSATGGEVTWQVPTIYRVTISGIADKAGNVMDPYSFSFTVLPEGQNTAPYPDGLDLRIRSNTSPIAMALDVEFRIRDADDGDTITATLKDVRTAPGVNEWALTVESDGGDGEWRARERSDGPPGEYNPSWFNESNFSTSGYYSFDVIISDGTHTVTYRRTVWVWTPDQVPYPTLVEGQPVSATDPVLVATAQPTLQWEWDAGAAQDHDLLSVFVVDFANMDNVTGQGVDRAATSHTVASPVTQGLNLWALAQEKYDPAAGTVTATGWSLGFGPSMTCEAMFLYGPDNTVLSAGDDYAVAQLGVDANYDDSPYELDGVWSLFGIGTFNASTSKTFDYDFERSAATTGLSISNATALGGEVVQYTSPGHGLSDGDAVAVYGFEGSDDIFNTQSDDWPTATVIDLDTFTLAWSGAPTSGGSKGGGEAAYATVTDETLSEFYTYNDTTGALAITQTLGGEPPLPDWGAMGRDGDFFALTSGVEGLPANIFVGARRFQTTGFTVDTLGTVTTPGEWVFMYLGHRVSGYDGTYRYDSPQLGSTLAYSGTMEISFYDSNNTMTIGYTVTDDGLLDIGPGEFTGYIGGSAGAEIIPTGTARSPEQPRMLLTMRKHVLPTGSTSVNVVSAAGLGGDTVEYTTDTVVADHAIVIVNGTEPYVTTLVVTAAEGLIDGPGGAAVDYTTASSHELQTGDYVLVTGMTGGDAIFNTPTPLPVLGANSDQFRLSWPAAPSSGNATDTSTATISRYPYDTPYGMYARASNTDSNTTFTISYPGAPDAGVPAVGATGTVTVYTEHNGELSGDYEYVAEMISEEGSDGTRVFDDRGSMTFDGLGGMTSVSSSGTPHSGTYHVVDGIVMVYVDVPEAGMTIPLMMVCGPDADTGIAVVPSASRVPINELVIMSK